MKQFYNNVSLTTHQDGFDSLLLTNISFTGNAIQYLSVADQSINLNEWEWHEEIINGQKHCIVTDKLPSSKMADESLTGVI